MARQRRPEAIDVAQIGDSILIVNGTSASRRPVSLGQWALDSEVFQVGEPELRMGLSLEASQTILDVVCETGFALLAVTHDVDAGRDLFGDGIADGSSSSNVERGALFRRTVERAIQDHVDEAWRARKTAHMCGQYAVRTVLHSLPLGRERRVPKAQGSCSPREGTSR